MTIFNSQKTDLKEDEFYCLLGNEDYLDQMGFPRANNENENVVAKVIFSKKTKHFSDSHKTYGRYYIKLDPNSKIFNPKQIFSSVKDKESLSFINNICKNEWNFKEVTPQIFQKYITFLRTKNLSWLKDAQRDLR
jgi:hypothetical protein